MKKTLFILSLLCAVAQGVSAQGFYKYVWCQVNESTHEVTVHEDGIHEATPLNASIYQLTDGWYSVDFSFTYNNRVAINGDVKLILGSNLTLTAPRGIFIGEGSTLTIYAQTTDKNMGKLVAYGEGSDWAAIGGNKNLAAGTLVIHGGNIHAEAKHDNAAAIGGGNGEGSGMKEIRILGGTVTAKSKRRGAGIGGGQNNNHFGTINIYGGTVTASSYNGGAGIGGGENRGAWATNIYGGTVNATGGQDAAGIGGGRDGDVDHDINIHGGKVTAEAGSGAAGIGAARYRSNLKTIRITGGTVDAKGHDGGAGIGGGENGNGGWVVITGGTVHAMTHDHSWFDEISGAGIGGGCDGYYGNVKIENANVWAESRSFTINSYNYNSKAIGRGPNAYNNDGGELSFGEDMRLKYCLDFDDLPWEDATPDQIYHRARNSDMVMMVPCTHPDGFTYITTETTHQPKCKYCNHGVSQGAQNHSFDPETGFCVCGYEKEITHYTVKVYMAAEEGMGYDDGTEYVVVPGNEFRLPVIIGKDLPLHMVFEGWMLDPGEAPDTWETTSRAGLVPASTIIFPSADVNLYARYSYRYGKEWIWSSDNTSATLNVYNLENDELVASPDVTVSIVRVEPTVDSSGSITYTASAHFTDAKGRSYDFTETRIVPLYYEIALDEVAKTDVIGENNGRTVTATLTGRTLYKDGRWNTLCLPFRLADSDTDEYSPAEEGGMDGISFTGTPLKGATVKEFASAEFDASTSTVTLNFTDANTIKAGKPYLVRWDDGNDLTPTDLVFQGVIISAEPDDMACDIDEQKFVTFRGTYDKIDFDNGDRTILFLGENNTLYHPQSDGGNSSIAACRAYIQINSNIGDVNGDGKVNVTDVTILVDYILGIEDEGFDIDNSDITGDGMVNVTDVTALVNLILSGSKTVNVVVNGADGITFGGGGNRAARVGNN